MSRSTCTLQTCTVTPKGIRLNKKAPSQLATWELFQGDTMSPIIFICFNPIIKLARSLSTPGFRFQILVHSDSPANLPAIGSTIYCKCNEPTSDETPKALFCTTNSTGQAHICYCTMDHLRQWTLPWLQGNLQRFTVQPIIPHHRSSFQLLQGPKLIVTAEHKNIMLKGFFSDDLTPTQR